MNENPKLLMNIMANGGYAADQVDGMSLADLRDLIDDAIIDHGEDAEVVLYDGGNRYGAQYGSLSAYDDLFTVDGEDDDD